MDRELGRKLRWLEEELLEEEVHTDFSGAVENEEEEEPEFLTRRNRKKLSTAEKTVRQVEAENFEEDRAFLVETRQERKQRLKEEKKRAKNGSLKGLVFLAVLEVCGILAIIGWWLQWLI